MPVYFYNEESDFLPKHKNEIKKWIKSVAASYRKITGDINFVFTNDHTLLKINQTYLDHHDLTDIITFDYSIRETLNGDIYISVDRVLENSTIFDESFNRELKRVIIHGILHLAGLKDKTESEKTQMRRAEELALSSVDASHYRLITYLY